MSNITNHGINKVLLDQLDKLRRHSRQNSYKTRQRYYEAMRRFCAFLASEYRLQKLANIAPKHINAYVLDMKKRERSATHIKTELSAIRSWHDQINGARYKIPPNDELSLERRSFGKTDRTWSDTEFYKMEEICRSQGRNDYASVLYLARHIGLRLHECLRIDTATAENAIHYMKITIKGKGGKIRTVPIQDNIKAVLEKVLVATKRGNKLFVQNGVDTHQAIKHVQNFIINHRDKVQDPNSECPLTFHGLRHTCASEWYAQLAARGYSDFQARKQVSLWLGHERDEVTKIYLASLN